MTIWKIGKEVTLKTLENQKETEIEKNPNFYN